MSVWVKAQKQKKEKEKEQKIMGSFLFYSAVARGKKERKKEIVYIAYLEAYAA